VGFSAGFGQLFPGSHEFVQRFPDRFTPDGDLPRKLRNATSSWVTMLMGQPGFFVPHVPNPWLSFAGARTATSYYDTMPLRASLQEFVDFSIINSQAVRFAVGAVNVLTSNFAYFDNAREAIEPEHVMASGALPPALPMIKIGTDYYWDGGIVSNTPLQHLLDQDDRINTLVFQVDLLTSISNCTAPSPAPTVFSPICCAISVEPPTSCRSCASS